MNYGQQNAIDPHAFDQFDITRKVQGMQGLAAVPHAPVESAMYEARSSADSLRKIVEELRSRLAPVLAPEQKVNEGLAKEREGRAINGRSPISSEFDHLARMSDSTAEVLSEILRRLEI